MWFTHFQLIVKGARCFSMSSFHLFWFQRDLISQPYESHLRPFVFQVPLRRRRHYDKTRAFSPAMGPSEVRWFSFVICVRVSRRACFPLCLFACNWLFSICCKTHEICSVNSQIVICNSVTLWQGKSCSLSHKWPAHMEISYSINVNRITILI